MVTMKPVSIPTEVNNFLLNQHVWFPCQIIKVWDHRGSYRSMSIAPIFKLVWNDWKLVTFPASWSRTAYDLSSSVQFSRPCISFADSNIHSSCQFASLSFYAMVSFLIYTSLHNTSIGQKLYVYYPPYICDYFKIKDIWTNRVCLMDIVYSKSVVVFLVYFQLSTRSKVGCEIKSLFNLVT